MSLKWGEPLKRGLGFCWNPKRWLPFFITDLACLLFVLLYIYCSTKTLISLQAFLLLGGTGYIGSFLLFLAPLFLAGVVCFLINLWITGAVIHQSHKEREFRKSWRISCRRYSSLLAAVIIVGLLTYIVSLFYTYGSAFTAGVGLLLIFIVSAALFFPLQIIMIKKQGFWDSLVGSWQLFQDQIRGKLINKKNILILILVSEILSIPVFLSSSLLAVPYGIVCWSLMFAFLSLLVFSRVCDSMVLVGIVSSLIVLIFSIPLLFVLWNILMIMQASSILGSGVTAFLRTASLIKESLLPLATSGIILLIGLSIAKTFSIKAQTEFYLQFRKKLFGLI